MKTLSILGSTGSIGTQTLEIVKNNPDEFKIVGLTSNNNIELLKKQIVEFKPESVAVVDKEKANLLIDLLKKDIEIKNNGINVDVSSGIDGIIKIATLNKADTVVNSLVGSIGLMPTIEAIKSKKNIALANKETLVTAGQIVMDEIKKNNVNLMPIDSEHSAIFQCISGESNNNPKNIEKKTDSIKKIILTASGGPFRNCTKAQLEKVTVKDALKHPTWSMGNKITIDSATLMNKGFEVIEAHYLYDIPYENIEVVIHPQSIIHSMVEFKDNSTLAQLSFPDMKIPIQYALSYPKRLDLDAKKLNLAEIKNLSFEKANFDLFPCLAYAYEAGKTGGTMPAVLNAANEVAVRAFLETKIGFLDISRIINRMISEHKTIKTPNLNQILEIDKKIKEETKKVIENKDY